VVVLECRGLDAILGDHPFDVLPSDGDGGVRLEEGVLEPRAELVEVEVELGGVESARGRVELAGVGVVAKAVETCACLLVPLGNL
jgi:hypothetical protein